MLASCSRALAGPSLAAGAHVVLDVPALQLRELSRTWRVTTSPRGRPIATAQSACPGPRKSMTPVGSRCCRPQAPGQGAGAQVSGASGWGIPSRAGLGVSRLGKESEVRRGAFSGQGRDITIQGTEPLLDAPARGRQCVHWCPALVAGLGLTVKPSGYFPLMIKVSLPLASERGPALRPASQARPFGPAAHIPVSQVLWPQDNPQEIPTGNSSELSQVEVPLPPFLQPGSCSDGKEEGT